MLILFLDSVSAIPKGYKSYTYISSIYECILFSCIEFKEVAPPKLYYELLENGNHISGERVCPYFFLHNIVIIHKEFQMELPISNPYFS